MEKSIKKNIVFIIGWIITIVQTVMSGWMILLLKNNNMIPNNLLIIAGIVLFCFVLLCRFLMKKEIRLISFVIGAVIAVLMCGLLAFANGKIGKLTDTLENITDAKEETTKIGVYVLVDDLAQNIQDASEYQFGILSQINRDDTDNAVEQIEEELSDDILVMEYDGTTELADALNSGDCRAIVISENFVSMISESEGYENFESSIREIASYEWKTVVKETSSDSRANESTDKEQASSDNKHASEDMVFSMYISGIDTYGDISTKSRSDVNIIAVVNVNTHQVLLVSTPRDYFVPLSISNGVKDKLTHAGIYGIEVSKDTLGMLYDFDIDYYFRVNFNGFEDMINSLDGVTVQSDYDFSVGTFHYVKGTNNLNAEEALAFARERYSFADGDRQRGRNQMEVIKGVIKKIQTPAVLNNFNELMESLEGSFQTDMPYDVLSSLVKDQLTSGDSWTVKSYSVDGTGSMSTTYSMNQELYVMIPDQSTVDQAKEMIQKIIDGEILD